MVRCKNLKDEQDKRWLQYGGWSSYKEMAEYQQKQIKAA